jgi:two-component system CheB/CheR fusion protein
MTEDSGALDRVRILVVDDNPDVLDMVDNLLAMNGAEVRCCRTASEARQLLGGFQPDLIISDLAMPEEDGFELIASIRQHSTGRGETPAIAFSGTPDPFARSRALASGFQEFVPKAEIHRLLAAVFSLIAGGRV